MKSLLNFPLIYMMMNSLISTLFVTNSNNFLGNLEKKRRKIEENIEESGYCRVILWENEVLVGEKGERERDVQITETNLEVIDTTSDSTKFDQ